MHINPCQIQVRRWTGQASTFPMPHHIHRRRNSSLVPSTARLRAKVYPSERAYVGLRLSWGQRSKFFFHLASEYARRWRTTRLVPNVEKFPGHIACDGASQSEIVVPIIVKDDLVGIIDIDCAVIDGFDEVDRKYLEQLAELLGRSCDWQFVRASQKSWRVPKYLIFQADRDRISAARCLGEMVSSVEARDRNENSLGWPKEGRKVRGIIKVPCYKENKTTKPVWGSYSSILNKW